MSSYEYKQLRRILELAYALPNARHLWVFARVQTREAHLREYRDLYDSLLKQGCTWDTRAHELTLPNRSSITYAVVNAPQDVDPLRGIEWAYWDYTDEPTLSWDAIQHIRILVRGSTWAREKHPLDNGTLPVPPRD